MRVFIRSAALGVRVRGAILVRRRRVFGCWGCWGEGNGAVERGRLNARIVRRAVVVVVVVIDSRCIVGGEIQY